MHHGRISVIVYFHPQLVPSGMRRRITIIRRRKSHSVLSANLKRDLPECIRQRLRFAQEIQLAAGSSRQFRTAGVSTGSPEPRQAR